MNVKVSNFSDDSNMSEMIHAVEHMSFMSTEKMSEMIFIEFSDDIVCLINDLSS